MLIDLEQDGLLELSVLLPPLAAGLLVLVSHLWLGGQVLQRGILFIDLAVAQLAALGSLLARQWLGDGAGLALLGGMLLAMVGAVMIGQLTERFVEQREAVIGLVYAGAASTLLLVLAADPHAGHRLSSSLNGDILWVNWSDLVPLAGLTAIFLGLTLWRGHWLQGRAFYPVFALLVSISVPLLGVYLVFVTLIAPALVAQLCASRRLAVLVAGVGQALGLWLALWLDWPAGATLVLVLLLLTAVTLTLHRLWQRHSTGTSSYSIS